MTISIWWVDILNCKWFATHDLVYSIIWKLNVVCRPSCGEGVIYYGFSALKYQIQLGHGLPHLTMSISDSNHIAILVEPSAINIWLMLGKTNETLFIMAWEYVYLFIFCHQPWEYVYLHNIVFFWTIFLLT